MTPRTFDTLDELIDALTDVREYAGGDTPLRVAFQPAYPLRGTISAVTPLGHEDGRVAGHLTCR